MVKRKRNPWVRRIAVVTLLLAVAAGTLYWKRAALRHYANDWSADRHLAHAERELAAGNHRVALSRALTAIELDPRRIEPLRVLCASARELRDSRSLVFATALAGHPEATDPDRLDVLSLFAEVGEERRFAVVFAALPESLRVSPEARFLRLRQRLQRGEGAGVVAALEIDPELLETWPGPRLRLEGLWQRAYPGDDAAAANLAADLLEQELKPDDRIAILEGLSQLLPSRIPPRSGARLLEALGEGIGTGEPPTLRDTLAIAAEPERSEAIVVSVVERLDPGSLGMLCRWLALLGEIETILEVTDKPTGLTDPIACEVRARALIETEDYAGALALLSYPVDSSDAVAIAILEAAAARGLGHNSDENAAWRKAQLAADSDLTRNRYLGLAEAARRAGRREVAVDAIVAACRHPVGLLPPAREIAWVMDDLVKGGRANDLLAVLARILPWEGGEPALINNAVYLSLILERAVGGAAVEAMKRIVEAHPEEAGFRNTLVLAYLAAGDAEAAIGLYPEMSVPGSDEEAWRDFSETRKAVYALALAENGDDRRFRQVVETIDWDSFFEKEGRFFESRLRPHLESEQDPEDQG